MPDTNLSPHIHNADLPTDAPTDPPTIPSFLTVAERFADEFWTSAIATKTAVASPATTPHVENAESPTDPFEFIPSPCCSEGDGSKSNGDLIEFHEETHTACSNAEREAETCIPEVEQTMSEIDAEKQIDKASPLVPSSVLLDPSGTYDAPPTPESVSLAAQHTPSQEEVDEAWPAPSNDNMNAADTWGVGTIAVPDTNPDDMWGSKNEVAAAGAWGTETRGECPNNDWKGAGGWKDDKERSEDRGYGTGGFRRDRPFWQPPERDGGWEGFRKRGGCVGDPSYLRWTQLFYHVDVYSSDLKAVVATIKIRVEATMIMAPGSPRPTIRDIPILPILPIVQLSSPPGAMPTTRQRMTQHWTHLWLKTSKQRGA